MKLDATAFRRIIPDTTEEFTAWRRDAMLLLLHVLLDVDELNDVNLEDLGLLINASAADLRAVLELRREGLTQRQLSALEWHLENEVTGARRSPAFRRLRALELQAVPELWILSETAYGEHRELLEPPPREAPSSTPSVVAPAAVLPTGDVKPPRRFRVAAASTAAASGPPAELRAETDGPTAKRPAEIPKAPEPPDGVQDTVPEVEPVVPAPRPVRRFKVVAARSSLNGAHDDGTSREHHEPGRSAVSETGE